MTCGNTSDFIGHPLPKDYISDPHMEPPTTPGPRAPTIQSRRWHVVSFSDGNVR